MNRPELSKAMILAAGLGTRLRPLTDAVPKPLLPLSNQGTLLDHVLDHLGEAGIDSLVINTHHLGAQLHQHIAETQQGVPCRNVIFSDELDLLDTGGGVENALPHLGGQPFFVVNSDSWWRNGDTSLLEQLKAFWDPDSMDALLVMIVKDRYIGYKGVGDYFWDAATGLLQHRLSLKEGPSATAPFVFMGVHILHPRLFDEGLQLHTGGAQKYSLKKVWDYAESRGRLYGILFEGQAADLGTIAGYETVKQLLEGNGKTG